MRLNASLPLSIQPAAPGALIQSTRALLELATITASAPTTVTNFDTVDQSVVYYTSNTSTNWTLNLRGNRDNTLNSIMAIGQALTIAVLVTNSSTAYYQTGFQVDSTAVSVKWSGGTTPTSGNINSVDIYSITVIKTANATFSAFGAQTRFA